MISLLSERSEEIQRFRENPWSFQQTFKTPLKDLERFVSTSLGSFLFERAVLDTDEVVFEPKNILELLARHSVRVENCYDLIIRAEEHQNVVVLLEAALADWTDFCFVPFHELVAVYADHDEYTTFYTHDLTVLQGITSRLENAQFELVLDYVRGSTGDEWR